jgi:hypothetical protein
MPTRFPEIIAAIRGAARQPSTSPCRRCRDPVTLWARHWCGRGWAAVPRRIILCPDCRQLERNQRNNERRRVRPTPMTCVQCGGTFTPKRADALTCSNKCRQAAHRARRA